MVSNNCRMRIRQHNGGSRSPYENCDSTLTFNGVLGRRSEFNLGDEDEFDDVIDCLEDSGADATLRRNNLLEDEGTLLRENPPNGTKPQQTHVQKIIEKSKANLSRSKSELGEQHRKVLSSIKQGRNEITEQNRRLLANITSGMERSKRL